MSENNVQYIYRSFIVPELKWEALFPYVISDDVLVVVDGRLSTVVSGEQNRILQIFDVPDVGLRVSREYFNYEIIGK